MTPCCYWCGVDAVAVLDLAPARMGQITEGGVKRRCVVKKAVTAHVCAAHADIRDRAPGTPMVDPRKKPAKVDQMNLFG